VYKELTDRLERIYSPRLALRRFSLSDGWPLFAATREAQFNKHLLWDQPPDEATLLERVDAICAAARRGRLAAVSAVVRETGEWVSLYRFIPYADDPTAMEMGVWTHARFWRDHYTQELTRMCIDAAFRCSKVDRLVAGAAQDNAASCRVLEKAGLRRTKPITRFTESGRPVLAMEHVVTRDDWLTAAPRQPSYREVPFPSEPSDSVAPVAPQSDAARIGAVLPGA
jgi:RimJ/RimL family protein N-acetyltransferase